jgi:hypothetical protein
MSTKSIDIIIIHVGNKSYLETNCKITGKNNNIYFIGDESCKYLEKYQNVTFIDISKYINDTNINNLKKSFINYSTNSANFEWACFLRVFIIHLFLKEYNLERVFHLDSDCVLLKDINKYNFTKEIAYCKIPSFNNPLRMNNSIHCGLLNIKFCQEFEKLYIDVFINKSKFELIEPKIDFHVNTKSNGGICDMTFYYLLTNLGILDVQNLLDISIDKDCDKVVFMNILNNGEGMLSKNQYQMNTSNIIKIKTENNKNLVYDTINNTSYVLFNIHFQGSTKQYMNDKITTELAY